MAAGVLLKTLSVHQEKAPASRARTVTVAEQSVNACVRSPLEVGREMHFAAVEWLAAGVHE